MTDISDLQARRISEQNRIRFLLNSLKAEEEAKIKGGEDAVAWVKEELCIGCDQCTIVCDDDAIELYDTPLASPIMNVDVNKKARILRDACNGQPFASANTISEIANAVGEIDKVKASASKFATCPI